jgi:hypothetical protein
MNEDLDGHLRKALRPVDPGERFTQSVLTRIANEPSAPTPLLSRTMMRWASATLATALVIAVVAAQQWQARRAEQGLEARRQLLEALRVTSDKLDIAYRAVNDRDSSSGASGQRRGS